MVMMFAIGAFVGCLLTLTAVCIAALVAERKLEREVHVREDRAAEGFKCVDPPSWPAPYERGHKRTPRA